MKKNQNCNFIKNILKMILRVQNQLINANYSRIFINLIRKSQWLENIREDSSDPMENVLGMW